MKSYIDTKGNLVKEPEGLEDQLELESPDLSAKLDKDKDWKAYIVTYRDSLYNHPSEEEDKLPAEEREVWNKMIDFLRSQEGLREIITDLENLKFYYPDLTNDKVLVIQSDRPLWDSIIVPEEKYKMVAWIGRLEKYEIIDPLSPLVETNETKILREVVLKDATIVPVELMKTWVGEKITNIVFHEHTEGLRRIIKKLNALELGKENIRIRAPYESIDLQIIEHEMSEIEKETAKLVRPSRFEVSKYMPERIKGMERSTGIFYKEDSGNYGATFVGKDIRDIETIYKELAYHLEYRKGLQVFVGKQLVPKLTSEQKEFLKEVYKYDRSAWLNKFFTEEGLELNNNTVINIALYDDEKTQQDFKGLVSIAESILNEKGYKKSGMVGYGCWGYQPDIYEDFSPIEKGTCYLGYSKGIK